MPKNKIANYQELLDLFAQLRVVERFDDLSAVIDETTVLTALGGTPRIKVEGYGFLPLAWDMDWYAMRFERALPVLGFYRDHVGKPVFYVTPRKSLDLFGKVSK